MIRRLSSLFRWVLGGSLATLAVGRLLATVSAILGPLPCMHACLLAGNGGRQQCVREPDLKAWL